MTLILVSMWRWCLCMLILASSISFANGAAPGLRLQVQTSALQKAGRYYLPGVFASLQKITIPAENSKHFGHDPIILDGLKYNTFTVASDDSGQLRPRIGGMGIHMQRTQFRVMQSKGVKISCRGFIEATIDNVAVELYLYISNDNGQPKVYISNQASIGTINIRRTWAHTGCKIAEKVVKTFIGSVNNKIANAIRAQLSPQIQNALTPFINNAMKNLVLSKAIVLVWPPDAFIFYDLVGPVTIYNKGISVGFRGEVNSQYKSIKFPTNPVTSDAHAITRDFELNVQDWTVNSGATTLMPHLKGTQVWSTTTTLSIIPVIGPLLYGRCPGCALQVMYRVNTPPVFDTQPAHGIKISIQDTWINVREITPAGDLLEGVQFHVNIAASAKPVINQDATAITATYACQVFHVSDMTSTLGPINIEAINPLAKRIIDELLVPIANVNFATLRVPNALINQKIAVTNVVNSYSPNIFTVMGDLVFPQTTLDNTDSEWIWMSKEESKEEIIFT